MSSIYIGVDVGGSGIKGALVDVEKGVLVTERVRVETPQPATPESVARELAEMVEGFDTPGSIGVGFPAVVRSGVVQTANNIADAWIGKRVADVFSDATGRTVTVLNDADAAAVAEARFGAARGVSGLVLTITFGTGIGSGLLVDGRLVPNLEVGQIELDGHNPAEVHFSAKARKRQGLSWDEWGARANHYLKHVNLVFTPELMVIGGGLTKHWDKYSRFFDPELPLQPAAMGNNAGLVGAAITASEA